MSTSVRAISAENVASLSGSQTVGGVACVTGDDVLLVAQSSAIDNGVWVVNSAGAWTRRFVYFAFDDEFAAREGSEFGNRWRVATTGTITPGTTPITFTADTAALGSAIVGMTVEKLPVVSVMTSETPLVGLYEFNGTLLSDGDRVGIVGQEDATTNGIYVAQSGYWERAVDANTSAELATGTHFYAKGGATNGRTSWRLVTEDVVLGTSDLVFIQGESADTSQLNGNLLSSPVNLGDVNDSINVGGGQLRRIPSGTLTANRTYTLLTEGASSKDTITLNSADNSAWRVNLVNGGPAGGSIISFAGVSDAVVRYDGTNWVRHSLSTTTSGSATDGVYYVSVDPAASDNNNGLHRGAPFATLERAFTALGSDPGTIEVGAGLHYVPAAGLILRTKQTLRGIGAQASQLMGINVTPGLTDDENRTAVITLAGSRSEIRDLWITRIPTNCCAVRVTHASELTPPGVWASNEDTLVTNIFVDNMLSGSVAFGIGDNTSHDVSNVILTQCTSVGNFEDFGGLPNSTHMHIGSGASANVLDILNIGGTSAGNTYGVIINGGSLVSTGLNFSHSAGADIWFKQGSVGPCCISGGRGENSTRFVISSMGCLTCRVSKVADYSIAALRNTDGRGIVRAGGPIVLENISLNGLFCPQFISTEGLGDDGATSSWATVTNCATDHPHPLRSPWSRPGRLYEVRGLQFTGDAQLQGYARLASPKQVRRKNISSGAAYSLNPLWFDAVDVRLSADAGAFTLAPGVIGQRVDVAFEQDGKGGRTWTWPANVAFDGGATPDNVTTSRNRQSARLEWSGQCWRAGAVTNTTPLAAAVAPYSTTFPTGDQFHLPSPWEHVPGGGSLGILDGVCVTNSLGWLGDDDLDGFVGFRGPAAGAVIETGLGATPTGVSATFVWRENEGLILHYLDDQTFFIVTLISGSVYAMGWYHGVFTSYGILGGPTLVAGTSHTLLVKCTSTGLDITVDGNFLGSRVFSADDRLLFNDLSKHGIFSASRTATFSAFSVS